MRPKTVLPGLWLLLMVSAGPCSSLVSAQTAARTATVSNSGQILAALQADADVLVLQNDVALGPEFDQFDGAPLRIKRNVTLTAPAGHNSSLDSMPVIDLQSKVGILELCSSCTFAFDAVNIANENRAGTGGGISVFRGQPGSRVEWVNGVGLRPACPPAASSVALINSTQRSSLFPSPPGGQQIANTSDLIYKGKFYKAMLHVVDLSSDVVPQQMTNSSFTGGYGIRRRNTTRLCEHVVSAQCLQVRLPEDCIAEVLAGGGRSSNGNSSSSSYAAGSSGVSVVAIAVPVAVGGVLIGAAAAVLLWRMRKRKSRRPQQGAGKPPANTAGPNFKFDPGGSPDLDVLPLVDQGSHAMGSFSSRQQQSSTGGMLDPEAAHVGPWQLLWSSSSSSVARESQNAIELGVLLGAGSFARVYKGRWSGLDVAVKVIHHDRDSVTAVANEVQLMLGLNHPNIVRAYHCITKQILPESSLSSPAAQQPPGMLQSQGPAVPRSAPGSVGSLGLHTPPETAPQFPPMASVPGSTGSSFLQHGQQSTDLVPLNSQSSFVPFISVSSSTLSSRALDRRSETTSSSRQASSSTAGLQPATPSSFAAAGPTASSLGPTPLGSTQFGVFSSSGVSSLAHDVDLGPAYMRRQQQQQQGSSSMVLGRQGSTTLIGGSSAVHTMSSPEQRRNSNSNSAGTSTVQVALSAGPAASASAGPTTVTAGHWPASFAVEPPILARLQEEYPVSGPNSAASVTSPSIASSGVVSSLVTPPSMSGTGQRPTQLPQLQQHQVSSHKSPATSLATGQQPATVLLPIPGHAIAGSGLGFASSGGSRASHNIQDWPPVAATVSEVQRSGAPSDGDGTMSGSVGSLDRAGLSARDRGEAGVEGGASAAMCETWLVTELCDRGTLARQASQWQPQQNELDMLQLLHLLRDVACGLKLLKSQHIVHADLNAHNVLVASSPVARHGLVAKVADLGLSRVLKQQATHRTTGTVGMLTHQPPELLQDGRMSPAVDIYSFGIMMFEVFTRQAAYGRLRYGQIYHQVVVLSTRPSIPPDMPEDYELLMKRCWSADPADRPSIDMLLECLELMMEARHED